MNENPCHASPTTPSSTCPLAIWSLVLGILSLLCFSILAGLPAVICGHAASSRIKKSAGTMSGRGLALAGLITGYLSIALIPFLALVLAIGIPQIVKARKVARQHVQTYHLRQLETVTQLGSGTTISVDGVIYKFAPQNNSSVNVVNSELVFKSDSLSVRVSRRTLTVNGLDHGKVEPGDTVEISASGEVTINGQPRTAQ